MSTFYDSAHYGCEQLEDRSGEDLHLIGCLAPFATMIVLAVTLIVCAIIAWIF